MMFASMFIKTSKIRDKKIKFQMAALIKLIGIFAITDIIK